MSEATPETIYIESAADPTTGAPMCRIKWGPVDTFAEAERIMLSADLLYAAAGAAETERGLLTFLETLDIPDTAIGAMIRSHRDAAKRPLPEGPKPILTAEGMVGLKTRAPLVQVNIRGHIDQLHAENAREVARDWMHGAAVAYTDAKIRYAMGDHGIDVVTIEDVMKTAKALDYKEPGK